MKINFVTKLQIDSFTLIVWKWRCFYVHVVAFSHRLFASNLYSKYVFVYESVFISITRAVIIVIIVTLTLFSLLHSNFNIDHQWSMITMMLFKRRKLQMIVRTVWNGYNPKMIYSFIRYNSTELIRGKGLSILLPMICWKSHTNSVLW